MWRIHEDKPAPEGEIQQFTGDLLYQESRTPVLDSSKEDKMRFFLPDQWLRYREE